MKEGSINCEDHSLRGSFSSARILGDKLSGEGNFLRLSQVLTCFKTAERKQLAENCAWRLVQLPH